nr:BamHI type II restriction endonuclease [Chloroflexota bacterium]
MIRKEILIDQGNFRSTLEYKGIEADISAAIARVVWPIGASTFTIYPERNANGVVPIKKAFLAHLENQGWGLENRLDVGAVQKRPGAIDATKQIGSQYFAVEWETGNISSSHRALNKIAIGMLRGVLVGGTLILPTSSLYTYLTDRVGNFGELEPYFDVWRSLNLTHSVGTLSVIAVEHDATSEAVEKIAKGTDGRALI